MSRIDVDAFMRQHRPRVIVYDFAPPYERNFRLFQHVRAMPAVEGCQFVLTSMNPANVADLVGRDASTRSSTGRRTFSRLVQAVKEASRARPTR